MSFLIFLLTIPSYFFKMLFFIGVVMMIVSTYATLYAAEKAQTSEPGELLLIPVLPSEIPKILKKMEKEKAVPPKLDGMNFNRYFIISYHLFANHDSIVGLSFILYFI
jgi:hypothetical protein